jgi:hypothetical protein
VEEVFVDGESYSLAGELLVSKEMSSRKTFADWAFSEK